MKKISNAKSKSPVKTKPDIEGFMARIEEGLGLLAKKIDSLTAQNFIPSVQTKETAKPFQRQEQPRHEHNHSSRQQNSHKERIMYQAVCAQCQNTCEVPFKPTGDRPVYCKECFSSRKTNGFVKPDNDHRPRINPETAGFNNSSAPPNSVPSEMSKKLKNRKPIKKAKR